MSTACYREIGELHECAEIVSFTKPREAIETEKKKAL
jgi:hypothetical protein